MNPTKLPRRTIGTTGPTGKIHVFDDGTSTCSTPKRSVTATTHVAEVPLNESSRGGILDILTREQLDPKRLCPRCFPQRIRDDYAATR